ncbi:MAG: YlbF family regulator [Halanaerobiaceae bacterium]
MSIMEKAKTLGQELAESEEYEQLKDAEEKMYEDEDAKNLLDSFESAQKRMQMAQANGQQPGPSQQQKLQTLQSQMQDNGMIKSYMEAQKQFNQVMKTVNQVISEQLQGEEQ